MSTQDCKSELPAANTTRDCVVLVGVPVNNQQWYEYHATPRGRDLLISRHFTQQTYEREVMKPFARARAGWDSYGVVVHDRVRCADIKTAIRNKKVAILISHWVVKPEPMVELHDGLHPVDAVARQFDGSFEGLVDLGICHPRGLAARLQRCRPKIQARWTEKEIKPAVWFVLYSIAFRLMNDCNIEYLAAMSKAMELINEN